MIAPQIDSAAPRIAVVTRAFPTHSQTFVQDHIAELHRLGFDVTVFGYRPEHPAPASGAACPVPVYFWETITRTRWQRVLGILRFLPRLSLRSIISILRDHEGFSWRSARSGLVMAGQIHRCAPTLDVVHAHFAPEGQAIAWLKQHGLLHAPLVVSVHGFDITRPLSSGKRPYGRLFRYADRIVVTTEFMMQQTLSLGCPSQKLRRNLIGLPLADFPFRPRTWRPGEVLRLLTVSRLVEKKGIRYAIEAIAKLRRRGLQVSYTVMGHGPLYRQLSKLAADLGISDAITFMGAASRAEVIAQMNLAHLFVFPSCTAADGDQEGQGMAALEAQACGIPVVASRHGGIPEIVLDGRTGLLVPEKDASAIASAIESLLARVDQWPNIGAQGRAFVASAFTLEQHTDRTLGIYNEVAASGMNFA